MGFNNVKRIIIMIFSVTFTAHYFKVTAIETFEQYVPCKPGWYFFGEKCYKIFPSGSDAELTWENSENSCIMEGGHLASIHSSELQEFLTTFLLLNSKSYAWIGLHDRVTDDDYSWVDESINNYTNWDDGEPSRNYDNKEEDCVEMRFRASIKEIGAWNDIPCSLSRPYICQIDKSNDTESPDPRFCSIEDDGGLKYLNSCYHIVQEEKSWEDAEKYCEEIYKGYLVSILDDNAEVFLDNILKISNLPKSVWIGIKMGNYSLQKWTSGWHVPNKKFNQDGLHFVNGTCVMKSNWKSWAIAPCHNKYAFICEKIKYNIPVLHRPPSDNWKCPQSLKRLLDFGGDSCYYIETKLSRTWMDANYECGKLGGTLASILSENETNILHPHILDTQERLLIGLKRNSEQNDVFEWADGSKFTYTNWDKWEPNNKNEQCGELWTGIMAWNDISCDRAKGYICKIKKVFSYSKIEEAFKNRSNYVPCNAALLKGETYSGGIPVSTVVGIVFCMLIMSLFIGVIAFHYQDYWMIYFSKSDKEDFTSTEDGTLGHVSDIVIWKSQGEHC